MDLEKEVVSAVRAGIAASIKEHLSGYSSPLKKLINDCFEDKKDEFKDLINDAISTITSDKHFRKQMIEQLHHKIARQLSNEFGDGIFKKNINTFKSDPMLKAKCILAIEKLIETQKSEN